MEPFLSLSQVILAPKSFSTYLLIIIINILINNKRSRCRYEHYTYYVSQEIPVTHHVTHHVTFYQSLQS